MMILVLAYFLLLPLQLSFMVWDGEGRLLSLMVFSVLVADIVINLNTGIFENGVVITNKFKIRKEYMKFHFWCDIISIYPFVSSIIYGSESRYLQLLIFLKFPRLSLIMENMQDLLEETIDMNERNETFLSLFKLATKILLLAHFLACGWHHVSFWKLDNPEVVTWLAAQGLVETTWQIR